jgi:HEAT repeat protein
MGLLCRYDLGRRVAWLRMALSGPKWADQFAALNSLKNIGVEATVPARSEIITLLVSERVQVVELAAETLGGMGREAIDAIPPLIGLLSHQDELARNAAIAALVKLSGEQFGGDAAKWENWYNLNK